MALGFGSGPWKSGDPLTVFGAGMEPAGTVEVIEDIADGEEVIIDLDLGLAARPFDADRSE
jgi:hypothetical protein